MLLKTVTAFGFKSFAEKIEIELGSGITAVVGPNGSGKSNISDAVRWVLGEQSAKYLRGSKMEDVIFNGTNKRRPLGVAEVTLVFDNQDHRLPLQFDEVSITRRLFRSGDSDYAINKKNCRLKDVLDLLADTGLGRGSMAIIGQNKIDEILNSRPEDRRAIFEEAAGIAKYRLRKKEAGRRLENTAENLVRINDIKSEVAGQVEPLKQAAEKTTQYNELAGQLRSCRLTQFVRQVDTIEQHREKLASAQKEAENSLLEQNTAVSQKQADCSRLQQEMDKLNDEYSALQEAIKDKETGLEKVKGQIAVLEERVQQSGRQDQLLDKRLAKLHPQADGWEEELQKLAAEDDEVSQAKAAAQQKTAKLTEEAAAKAKISADGQKQLQDLTDSNFEDMRQMVELRNNIRSGEQEQERRMRRRENLKQEAEALEARSGELRRQSEALQQEQGALQQKQEGFHRDDEAAAKSLQEAGQKFNGLQQEYARCLKQVETTGSRIQVLQQMQQNYEGFGHGIKAVLQSKAPWRSQMKGVLAALLKVEPQYVTAIETALGYGGQNIVVETAEAAKQAIGFLKASHAGRVTFLPLDTVKVRGVSAEEESLCDLPGVDGFAADLISFDQQLAPAVRFLLGRVLIAENMDVALEAARRCHFRLRVVTRDGDVINAGGSMTGGSRQQKETGYLSRVRTLEQLEQELSQYKEVLLGWQEKREIQEEAVKQLKQQREKYRQGLQDGQVHLAKLEEGLLHLQTSLQEEDQRLELALSERKQLAQEYLEHRESLQALQPQLAQMEAKHGEAKATLDKLQQTINAASSALSTLNNRLQDAKVESASLEARSQAISERMQDMDQNLSRLQEEIAANEKEKEQLAATVSGSEGAKQKLQQETEKLLGELRDITSGKEDFSGQRLKLAEQEAVANEQLNQATAAKAKAEAKVHQSELDQARLDEDYQQALEQLKTEYKLSLEEARQSGLMTDQSDTALRRREGKLQREIEALGPINMGAIQEYEAVKERFDFLEKQYQDLAQAKQDLESVISEINTGMTKRFREAFGKINSFFADTYARLFGGGTAALKLTDPEDYLESGVDIEVQPPGKHLQSLFLLSGGERALTVIALLFALLSFKPAPFCILDEIDAPLDDANIERFAKFLKDYSQNTQFIVITHRKGTMEAADIMYGVTMEELGVSKLLSVKMSERK